MKTVLSPNAALRKEIHNCIDDIPEGKLLALKPLLFALADDAIVVENNLTEEERLLVATGMNEYKRNPDSFVLLKT